MDNHAKQTPPFSRAAAEYRHVFAERTPEERRTLAQIKRFMERVVADPAFRAKLNDNIDDPSRVAEDYGIDIDATQLRPLWHAQYTKYRQTEEMKQWPLAALWDDHMARMIAHRDLVRDLGACAEANPRFHAWRERQISRSASELGTSASAIVHPIAAYELSDGCSLGCWFCGISADKFKGNWPYTSENAELWRGVLEVMFDLFGEAAQTGFCYWGTDPADNPDYPRFIEDHYQVTGVLPQTTTAAPLKNLELTREVFALHEKYPAIVNRFSITSLKILDKVHAEFSADELLEVELVTQNRESLTNKANAGRAAERKAKKLAQGRDDKGLNLSEEHSTIACVSGFLLNMVNRTVKLVSPTRASEKWPLGYRVYEEAHFDSPEEFRHALEGMTERHMPESLTGTDRVAFREDLEFARDDEGFTLQRGANRYDCKAYAFSAKMGELIHEGKHTAGDIVGQLVEDGANVFLVGQFLQQLFDHGLLNDDPKFGGIDGGREYPLQPMVRSSALA